MPDSTRGGRRGWGWGRHGHGFQLLRQVDLLEFYYKDDMFFDYRGVFLNHFVNTLFTIQLILKR